MTLFHCTVLPSEDNCSLLAFLRQHAPHQFSVKTIKRAIEEKSCTVNGKLETFSSIRLKKGDRIQFDLSSFNQPKRGKNVPILFEDEFLLICNKPAGMLSESAVINQSLPEYRGKLLLVHRLDKETSGALILAKESAILEKMILLFRKREVRKLYLALVEGEVKKEKGRVDNYLSKKNSHHGQVTHGLSSLSQGGQHAVTLWKCLKAAKIASLLLAEPVTGRTHQLRVHFQLIGHPIAGDAKYGSKLIHSLLLKRHLLHAYSIRFIHPLTNQEIEAIAPIPFDFQKALTQIGIRLG